MCWLALLAGIVTRVQAFAFVPWLLAVTIIISLWGLAILCAIVSILRYWRMPKPWYVILNLTINISGLLFTFSVLLLLLSLLFWSLSQP